MPTITHMPKALRRERARLLIDELTSLVDVNISAIQWTKLSLLAKVSSLLAVSQGHRELSDHKQPW